MEDVANIEIINQIVTIIGNLEFFFQFFFAVLLFSLKLKRRNLFPLRAIGAFLISGLISYYWNWEWGLYLSILRYLVLFGIYYLAIYFCFELNFKEAAFIATSSYILQHFAFQISQLVLTIIFNTMGQEIYRYFFYIRIPINVITFTFVYVAIYFSFVDKVYSEKIEIINNKWLWFGMIVVLTTNSLNLAQSYGYFQNVIFMLYSMIFCLIAVYCLSQVVKSNKLEQENLIIEKMLEMKKEYTEMNQSATELINIRCHDLKHQLQALKQTNLENKEEEKNKLVQEIQDEIDLYDSFITTNIPSLDVVLTQKAIYCQKNKIKFTAMVSVESLGNISSRDIYSLFGNSLDNAIESVSKLTEQSKKVVSLIIFKENNELNINVSNYYEGEIIFKNNLPQTQKKDKKLHGFGVKSIQYIVNKYNGKMNIELDDNIFTLEIKIPYVEK